VAHTPGHERHRERQRGQQVARREPEAEHRRSEECRDQQLRAERSGAEAGCELDLANPGDRVRQPVAVRAPQQPEAAEREGEDRRPAQEAVVAIHEQRHQPVGALEVAGGEGGVRRGLSGRFRRVRGRAAVDGLVDRHEERHGEERYLHGADGESPPARPPDRQRRVRAHHHARGQELRAEPGERAEQQEAERRVAPRHARRQPHGEQRRAGERGGGGQLGVNGRAVGQQRRAQPYGQRRAERPRVGRHAQRQPVRERDRKRRQRSHEQLDRLRAPERVRGRDQGREAQPVRLVQPAIGLAPVRAQLVGVEAGVGALPVLVEHVHVAVVDDRVRREQVVRLVAAVIRARECVEPERCRVDAEQQQPEGEGATHRRRTLAAAAYATTAISS
jgi:hypothetical protein